MLIHDFLELIWSNLTKIHIWNNENSDILFFGTVEECKQDTKINWYDWGIVSLYLTTEKIDEPVLYIQAMHV